MSTPISPASNLTDYDDDIRSDDYLRPNFVKCALKVHNMRSSTVLHINQ